MVLVRRMTRRLMLVLCMLPLIAVALSGHASAAPTVSDPVTIQSGCTFPPCGEIYNDDNMAYQISRQDCDGCGWIYSWIYPGQHKGGYWNDGIDWDRFAVPAYCSVSYTVNGSWYGWGNNTSSPLWLSFSSNQTVRLKSHNCW
jgi:hypothetical protein